MEVYDECRQNGTHYFILSTLKYYILGEFSDDWGTCIVSAAFKYQNNEVLRFMMIQILRGIERVNHIES